jgi:glycosyltransferase involved in cell wall biosynthesis
MTILFLCGGLQPGKDGVGDYSRRLAGELNRHGNECSIIAMNDADSPQVLEEIQQDLASTTIKVLRLPRGLDWKVRMVHMDSWIKKEKPDWISLQYVPFAFQRKGIPLFLAGRLKRISKGVRWHIMFHELWVGRESIRQMLLSKIQRQLIIRQVHRINANVVHTHLPLYLRDLVRFFPTVKKLPLFSNFPMVTTPLMEPDNLFRIGFFNQVGQRDQVIDFLLSLSKNCNRSGLDLQILLIGGAASSVQALKTQLETYVEFKDRITCTGFLDERGISASIANCSIGITPLSFSTLGKSGTSAAFLAQGIALAVPVIDDREKPFFNDELMQALITVPDFDKINFARKAAQESKYLLSLSEIARIFLNDLKSYPL